MSSPNRINRLVLSLSWLLLGAACALSGPDVRAEESDAGASTVLATIGASEVTSLEVEEMITGQLRDLERQRHELLENALNQAVEQKLFDLEAAERGVSTADLVAQEVTGKVIEPSEEDVDQFFNENRGRIQGTKEQFDGRIRDFLKQQREFEARAAFVTQLRARYEVKSFLEPLRTEVAGDGPSKGPENAAVTIVEFSDFECPYCSRLIPSLDQVRETYGDQVRIVFRQFPLPIHSNAQKAAEASLCADDQGKFWEMHDWMFGAQRTLAVEQLKERAIALELDAGAFNECLDSSRHADRVQADLEAGQAIGVNSTPTMFINGRFLSGAQPFEEIARVIDDELDRAGIERVQ